MLNRFLINAAASQLLNGKQKPPWEDNSNYRVSKRGYHSNCHLWHNTDELADIRDAVWKARWEKSAAPLTLISQCGSDRCVRHTHLKPVSKSNIEFIALLREERKHWRHNMGSIRLLARSMMWDENEISLVLGIPRRELKEMLENGPEEDVPYGERSPRPRSEQPRPLPDAVTPALNQQLKHQEADDLESDGEPTQSGAAMPSLPPIPTTAVRGQLGNPSNLTARPGNDKGTLEIIWSPAANATAQFVYFRPDGSADAYRLPEHIPCNCGEASLSGLAAGRYWFILIACQKFSDDDDVVWSEWSNWATADVS